MFINICQKFLILVHVLQFQSKIGTEKAISEPACEIMALDGLACAFEE